MAGKTLAAAEAGRVQNRNGGQVDEGGQSASLAILAEYWPKLKRMLPVHIVPEAWYAGAFAALYRNPQLRQFADVNPESLMFALMDCARLGLEPGTKEYYLTPRPNNKAKGGKEVLGIQGYVGVIERMYRAGAVTQVVVEVVRENDEFRYSRAAGDEIPLHEFNPLARRKDRGALIGVYAYARMITGNWSTPVVLNQDDIDRSMKASPTAKSDYSPWKTDTEAMWKKTAVHRLENWVPTSSNYVNVQRDVQMQKATIEAQAAAGVLLAAEVPALPLAPPAEPTPLGAPGPSSPDDNPVGNFRPAGFAPQLDTGDTPDGPYPEDGVTVEGAEAPEGEHVDGGGFEPASQTQHRRIMAMLGKRVQGDEHRHALFTALLDRTITSQAQVSATEAEEVYEILKGWGKSGSLDREVAALAPGTAPAATTTKAAELPKPGTPEWHADGHPSCADGINITRVPNLLNGDCAICEDDR